MMTTQGTAKIQGPWFHRFLVGLFSFVLTVLFYWLLGFVVHDIGRWPGPSYQDLEASRLDRELVDQSGKLEAEIVDARRGIKDVQTRQKLLRDSTNNSQQTMRQLLEMQQLHLQKGVTPLPQEQQALADSETLFLANQKQYQQLNEQAVTLNEKLLQLEQIKRELDKTLKEKRQPIQAEFDRLRQHHQLKVAAAKLAFLIPLLAVAVTLFLKFRGSPYTPLIYTFGIAVLLKVGEVMHEYFPAKYFKYVLILASLAVVLRILVYLLRMMAFPKRDWLLRQYREAYEVFLCPVCGFPIRRGPLKYAFWNRRSVKKLGLPREATAAAERPYTCPTCSTQLLEECSSCHAIRHSLLPTCEACGATRPVAGLPTT